MARVGSGKGAGSSNTSMQVSPELLYGMLTMPKVNNDLATAMSNLTGGDFESGLELLAWCAVYIHAYCY